MLGRTRDGVRHIEKRTKAHMRVQAKMKALADYPN